MKAIAWKSLIQPAVAELVGTMVLAAVISILTQSAYGIIGGGQLYIFLPFVVAIVVGLLVYLFGPISGAHFNPAVTLTLASYRKLDVAKTISYVIAQIGGAFLGYLVLPKLLISGFYAQEAATTLELNWQQAGAEALGAFVLIVAIMLVVLGKVKEELSGLVIGSALLVGILLSVGISGASLNPALALAMYEVNPTYLPVYLIAPVLGGLLGGGLAIFLTSPLKQK